MQSFTFCSPTEIAFGKNACDNTAALIKRYGGSRVILVYGGGSAERSGLIDRMKKQLTNEGIAVMLFGGVQPNPTLQKAREGVAAAISHRADFVLSVGGGSAIDLGKAVAHGAASPGSDIWKFWTRDIEVTKSLATGCILTISAAGSETSDSAVLTNEETGQKRGLSCSLNRPRFAVMDPQLTFSVPRFHTACGIADIMMHTMERFFTAEKGINEITDRIAVSILKTVIKYAPAILRDPCDYGAASEIMWCGSLSHNGITGLGRPSDFSVHQMGHELSARFDSAHGASLTAVWGAWAEYCYQTDIPRFAYFARSVWDIPEKEDGAAAKKGIEMTVDFFRSAGMPVSIKELLKRPLSGTEIKELAFACSYNGTRRIGSLKPLGTDEIAEVYRAANI